MTANPQRRMLPSLQFAAAALAVASLQCGSDSAGSAVAGGARPDGGNAGGGGAPAGGGGDAAVTIPDFPAGAQLQWVLDLMNGPPEAITAAAVTPHFSAAVLQEVPAEVLAAQVAALARSEAPLTLTRIESSSPGFGLAAPTITAIVQTGRPLFLRLSLSVTPADARITRLLFTPAPEYDLALADPAALNARLTTVAARAGLLIARLDGGACAPLHALAADQPLPIGSMFKLYVLGALTARIQAGEARWTDLITVQDGWKSLPSGVLQDQPEGTTVAVDEAAARMIAISDNTAADHLIHFIGRERVEAHQSHLGHATPALNVPFLTTRELFVLKLSATPEQRAAFLAADPAGRRKLLNEDYDKRPLPALALAAGWKDPVEIDRLEWFASPADLCRGFAALRALGEKPDGPAALAILAENPGLPVDRAVFSYVGFKGGSEPGVLAFGWLLRRADDGAWLVAALGLADATRPIEDILGIYYAQAVLQLAGRLR